MIPKFEDSPASWLTTFDRIQSVQDRYEVLTDSGIVQVMVSDAVKGVLNEIKRMPGRRVAGQRAMALMMNPRATLGEHAGSVISEADIEVARNDAGIFFSRFYPQISYDSFNFPTEVAVAFETPNSLGEMALSKQVLDALSHARFVAKLSRAIESGDTLLSWGQLTVELFPNNNDHLVELQKTLEILAKHKYQVTQKEVYELSGYAERITAIGVEEVAYVPGVTRLNDQDGWFPENIIPVIGFTPEGRDEMVMVHATEEVLEAIQMGIDEAVDQGVETVDVDGLPKQLTLIEAKLLHEHIKDHVQAIALSEDLQIPDGSDTENPDNVRKTIIPPGAKPRLIHRSNFLGVDFGSRSAALQATEIPQIPFEPVATIRPSIAVMPHQMEGVAWMQNLYRARVSGKIEGCILADDMGLGKTFQMLLFIAWAYEHKLTTAPALIVAPVSLLENWEAEAGKFFKEGTFKTLTAYGDNLKSLRVPRSQIDDALKQENLVNFLKPNWVGQSNLVLTTYETLRDLEFSFAKQSWFVVACDEAQKIKNPVAQVSRTAKKLKAEFKIACTGTPVENTIVDLWSLFDFVQPGLLCSLDVFARDYKKPIETTVALRKANEIAAGQGPDEEAIAELEKSKLLIEELRTKITPQLLRRTKAQVATLPKKHFVQTCKKIPISSFQRGLYSGAVNSFFQTKKGQGKSDFKSYLQVLQYLRTLCGHPQVYGFNSRTYEALERIKVQSPKVGWLLNELEAIKRTGEKAIIFCEFKQTQAMLQYYIEKQFGFKPDIVNGEVSASSKSEFSRQKKITAFQAQPGFSAIILSPVAVGFGVNIQAANHVIHYSRTWNPAKEDQATDRAYRIGQTRDVYVYCPTIHAHDFDTFEVVLDRLLDFKRSLAGDILNGCPDVTPMDIPLALIADKANAFDEDAPMDAMDAMDLDGRFFEGLAAAVWKQMDYPITHCTPQSGDHGVDVVAINQKGDGVLIQVKTSSTFGHKMGWDIVKDVVGGKAYYELKHPNTKFKLVAVTNQYFGPQAIQQGRINGVELVDRDKLLVLLDKHPVKRSDILKFIDSPKEYAVSDYFED